MGPMFLQMAIVSSSNDFPELGYLIHRGKYEISNTSVVSVKKKKKNTLINTLAPEFSFKF